MILQAAPLYGYAWAASTGRDESPDCVMVIGWEPLRDGDFTEYYPVVAWLDNPNCGTAFALDQDWTWSLTPAFPEKDEGVRIKARWHRETDSLREFLAAERQKREAP